MSKFFACLNRLKHIKRWSLMRSTEPENVLEHSAQVGMVAHALAVIRNELYGGSVDPGRVVTLALYHDATEVLTGDVATPIKYRNARMRSAYQELDGAARQRLLGMIPDELLPHFESVFAIDSDEEAARLVHAADKICAYLKCMEELRLGNPEFEKAAERTRASVEALKLPEVAYFMGTFAPSFAMTIDELNA